MTEPRPAQNGERRGAESGTGAGPVRRFGVFEMDLGAGELRKGGVVVHLQPQPFSLLALLTARPGEVVTRQEMRDVLWPTGTPVDFEQSLSFCIRQIRLALDDSAQAPRFVETLPRRGYRWVGPSETSDGGPGRKLPSSPAGGEAREQPGPETRTTPASGPRWRWVVPLLGLVGLAIVGLSVLRQPGSSVATQFQRVTFRRGFLTGARFGPGGRIVYIASWDGGPLSLYETRADSGDARSLGMEAFGMAGVSTSGEVAFVRDGMLSRAPLAGGPPRMVARGVRAADWTARGSAFALARELKEGYQLEYPIGHSLLRVPSVGALRLSPDGEHLAFSQHPTLADDRGFAMIVDREGSVLARSATFGSLEGLAWSPRGDEVWFTAAGLGVKNSLRALGLDGRERMLLESIGRLVLHDVAPDGRLLISRSTLRAEISFQRAGEPDVVDLSWLDVSAVAALSPDGDTVLFYEGGEGGGPDYTTFTRRTDGSRPVRLGDGRAFDLSPDGRWAAVIPVTSPDRVLLLPTGAGEPRQIRGPGGMVTHDAAGWLSDGETLFVTGRDGNDRRSTWLVDMQGRQPRRLPLPEGRYLTRNTFSPDGTVFVAGCPPPDRNPCLYPVAGGSPRRIPGAGASWTAIGWDRQGRVFFRDRPGLGRTVNLHRLDPGTGSGEVITPLTPPDPTGIFSLYRAFVTPDASAWAFNVIRRQSDLFIATGAE
ncbi:MAG: winged helix-turn-helix domain-containing protein [Acidobacteria bacterium]|nr:winged helix-turn-helix domain-containing protein [Acidobacteriota bacterium]